MTSVILSKSVIIQASQAQVFDAITDWDHQAAWMIGTKVHGTVLDGHAVEGQIEARTAIGPFGFLDTMTVTAWQPPDRCSVQHTGKVVRGSGDFIVTRISEESAQFTWNEHIDLPFGLIGRICWYCFRPLAILAIIISLRRFKRWIERTSL
jgi:hypothetical protein